MDPHRLAELRSIAYHRRVVELLADGSGATATARERVERWARDGSVHREYVAAWRRLLDLPPAALAEALVGDDEQGRALRQVSPFAGVLGARERWAIHRRVRQELDAV